MQPSSLIFLILIGIWAAYLLQHWVRRREHLATARSVDRFSDAMRVLERREPLPELDLSAPRPRSYALSPARPALQIDLTSAVRDVVVRPTTVFRVLAALSSRRVRGLSLLASVLLALVISPLAALSLLPWWNVLVVVAVAIADLTWLRRAAVSERAAGRGQSQTGRAAADPSHAGTSGCIHFNADSGVEFEVKAEVDAEAAPPYDGQAAPARERELSRQIEPAADADLSGWAPVPVPPPTYTLKAKAADPMATPAPVTEPAQARWSLDGMVYDCDRDELVERHSATGA